MIKDNFDFVVCVKSCYLDGSEFNPSNIDHKKKYVNKGNHYYVNNKHEGILVDHTCKFYDVYVDQPLSDDTFFGVFPTDAFRKATVQEVFRFFNIEDNPFDVMYYMSLELTRCVLFDMHRCGVDVIDRVAMKKSTVEYYTENIKKQFDIIHSLPADVKEICRQTSIYGSRDFTDQNKFLFSEEQKLDIKKTQCVPVRNIEFEKARLGSCSHEYFRLTELRNSSIIRDSLLTLDKSELYRLIEYIDLTNATGESLQKKMANFHNMDGSSLDYGTCRELVERFNLTSDEIEFLIRYKQKRG